jgi:surfactin family lipopeptide synthetase A
MFPVVLATAGQPRELICHTKEMLRRVPHKGVGYGVLKYLSPLSAEERAALGGEAEISFNYLGHVTAAAPGAAAVPAGDSTDRDNRATGPLAITALLRGERLGLSFSYDTGRFTRAELETLAGACRARLGELVNHCLAQGGPVPTASDFGAPELTSEDLKEILE